MSGSVVVGIDQAVLEIFVANRPHVFSEIVAVFSEISRPAYVLVVAIFVAAIALARGNVRVLVVPVSLALTNGLVHVLKPLIGRDRPHPEFQLIYEFSAAMPSGHSAAAVALATSLSLLRAHPAALIAVWVWAILVALSRLYLGVHWFSDVLVGGLIGVVVATIVWAIVRTRFDYKH